MVVVVTVGESVFRVVGAIVLKTSMLDGAGAVESGLRGSSSSQEHTTDVGTPAVVCSCLDMLLTFADNPNLQAQQKESHFTLSCSSCIWNFK